MREIKFRAWNYGFNKMEYHVTPSANEDGRIWLKDEDGEPFSHREGAKDSFIIMQFTGLHDKNGKEIWEGDIIKGNNSFPYGDKAMQVVWDDKRAGFFVKSTFVAYDPKNLYKLSGKTLEVLGNIYEHSSLLDK